jgi:integrase
MEQTTVNVIRIAGRKKLALRWKDPETGVMKQKSAGTENQRIAERKAGELQAELREGRYATPSRIGWEEFRERYEKEEGEKLSKNTLGIKTTVLNHVETILGPSKLSDLTPERLSRFEAVLREQKTSETTINGYRAHLGGILAWAEEMKFMTRVKRKRRKRAGSQSTSKTFMRGRPITGEEFDRMIAVVPSVRPKDSTAWENYLTGLWLSGLRLEESLKLSWDLGDPDGFVLDWGGKYPRFRIEGPDAQKSGEDQYLPLTPDFADFLKTYPECDRQGKVFKLIGLQPEDPSCPKPITPKTVCRLVSKIGRKAGVVVNKASGKFASAHDLRRAFGTRYASKVMPATLQRLMRHKSIETTLRYYVSLDAEQIAEQLWKDYVAVGVQMPVSPARAHAKSDTSGDTEAKKGSFGPLAETGDLPESRSCYTFKSSSPEGKRMASGDTGNVVPGNRLRVRAPCPPLSKEAVVVTD